MTGRALSHPLGFFHFRRVSRKESCINVPVTQGLELEILHESKDQMTQDRKMLNSVGRLIVVSDQIGAKR